MTGPVQSPLPLDSDIAVKIHEYIPKQSQIETTRISSSNHWTEPCKHNCLIQPQPGRHFRMSASMCCKRQPRSPFGPIAADEGIPSAGQSANRFPSGRPQGSSSHSAAQRCKRVRRCAHARSRGDSELPPSDTLTLGLNKTPITPPTALS